MSTVEMWARELSLDSSIPFTAIHDSPLCVLFVLVKAVVLFRSRDSPGSRFERKVHVEGTELRRGSSHSDQSQTPRERRPEGGYQTETTAVLRNVL